MNFVVISIIILSVNGQLPVARVHEHATMEQCQAFQAAQEKIYTSKKAKAEKLEVRANSCIYGDVTTLDRETM